MQTTETALRTAAGYIQDVENLFPEFSNFVSASDEQATQETGRFLSDMAGMAKGRFGIAKEKTRIIQDLRLADQQIAIAEEQDPGAVVFLPHEDGSGDEVAVTIPAMKAARHRIAAMVESTSGRAKSAEREIKESLAYVELPDSYWLHGCILAELKKPREACEAFALAADLDPNGEFGLEAQKALGRLEAQRVFDRYWFTGSWKVLAFLAAITVLSGIIVFSDPVTGAVWLVFWGALTGLYLWRKLR